MELWNKYMLFVLALLTCVYSVRGQGECVGMTPCYCQFENGQFLHLAGLARSGGLPRFVNVSDSHEISYSWNPCLNFTEGDCTDVAMCAIESSYPHDIYTPLGYQDTASFSTNMTDNSVTLTYKAETRSAHIRLVCTRTGLNSTYFEAYGQETQKSSDYYFRLSSPLACPQGTPNESTTVAPPTNSNVNKALEIALISVSVLAVLLLVSLIFAILKIKGKICKKVEYDEL